MTKKIILLALVGLAFGALIWFRASGSAAFVWSLTRGGTLILPLVVISALLDSIHPCSFSILLLTIAFLLSIHATRKKILAVGGIYIAGIFLAYLLIGLGVLKVFHFFNTPHFMGKLGAILLVLFGVVNLLNEFFPSFPIRLRLPKAAHGKMASLMEKTSIGAAFFLGMLVGVCQFPCMGGPYLMVIGFLHDQMTYASGFGYLTLYNLILILPLLAVLFIAGDKAIVEKVTEWKKTNLRGVRLWGGIIMILLGFVIFLAF